MYGWVMPLPLISRERALTMTEPFHGLWAKAFRDAEEYVRSIRDLDTGKFLGWTQSAVAHAVQNIAVDTIRRDSNVLSSSRAYDAFSQIINGEEGGVPQSLTCKFKLLDRNLSPHTHSSGRTDALKYQTFDPNDLGQLGLDGMAAQEPTHVTVGYTRGFDVFEIGRVIVVCHYGSLLWWYDVESESGVGALPLPGIAPPLLSKIIVRTSKENESTGTE